MEDHELGRINGISDRIPHAPHKCQKFHIGCEQRFYELIHAMHCLEGPLGRDNCRLQRHQAQACYVIGYHCLVVDDAGSLGEDKRVAIVVKHGDADAAGYVGDLAGVDFYELKMTRVMTAASSARGEE